MIPVRDLPKSLTRPFPMLFIDSDTLKKSDANLFLAVMINILNDKAKS